MASERNGTSWEAIRELVLSKHWEGQTGEWLEHTLKMLQPRRTRGMAVSTNSNTLEQELVGGLLRASLGCSEKTGKTKARTEPQ